MESVIADTISSVIASAADSEAVSEPPFIADKYLEVSSFAVSFVAGLRKSSPRRFVAASEGCGYHRV